MSNIKKPAAPVKSAAKKAAVKQKTIHKGDEIKSGVPRKTSNRLQPVKQAVATELANIITQSLEDLKAKNIVQLNVQGLTDIADIFIIASGTSNRHVKSLAENAAKQIKANGYKVFGIEGDDIGEWVLVDAGGVIVHVMQPHIREFYDLEKLWGSASPGN